MSTKIHGFEVNSGFPPIPVKQALTAAGAIDLQARSVTLAVAEGTYAVTLAAATEAEVGVLKAIDMTDDTGTSVTLVLTNVRGVPTAHTLATFDANGESLVVIGTPSGWLYVAATAGLSTPG